MRVRELRVSYLPRGDVTWDNRSPLRTPLEAAALVTRILKDEAVEVFCTLCLNTKQRLLGFHEASRGTLDSTIAHPREVFKAAILANAAAVIVAHYVARHIMRLMCR
jgi:DNA repair protein RadC